MNRKIAIVGPESTGKTHLAEFLSNHFKGIMIPEFAREYLNKRNGHYEENDLLKIARGQLGNEAKTIEKGNAFLFCDTNLLVIKIWSLFKYGKCNKQIVDWWESSIYDLHLLLSPDIPYQIDPLRENPDISERKELFHIYEAELKSKKTPYVIIKGNGSARNEAAVVAVEQHFFL